MIELYWLNMWGLLIAVAVLRNILWLESSGEHLPKIIAGVPSATLGTGSSTPRHKPSFMRQICAALRSG
jgi:hypothetical protein